MLQLGLFLQLNLLVSGMFTAYRQAFSAATILWVFSLCVTGSDYYTPDYAQDAPHYPILQSRVNAEITALQTEPTSFGHSDVTLTSSMNMKEINEFNTN